MFFDCIFAYIVLAFCRFIWHIVVRFVIHWVVIDAYICNPPLKGLFTFFTCSYEDRTHKLHVLGACGDSNISSYHLNVAVFLALWSLLTSPRWQRSSPNVVSLVFYLKGPIGIFGLSRWSFSSIWHNVSWLFWDALLVQYFDYTALLTPSFSILFLPSYLAALNLIVIVGLIWSPWEYC